MNSVKKYMYDTLVEEYSKKPCFLLARSLFLFCHFNPTYEMPGNIQKAFVNGLLEDEVRAFNLRYHSGGKVPAQTEPATAEDDSLSEIKKDIYKEIAAENLSKGTGKTYTPSMIDKLALKYKAILSYNEILEIVVMSAHKKL